ncbi:MAG: hypothetical protein FWF63_08425 [Fibromonadales bacterium]|nr:hypothetical protein [Fibromonadales bacterium]
MNTITVDLGPTIIGAGVDAAAKTLGKKLKNVDISALGYAAQYELQPIRFLSLPLRYAYMDFKTGVKEEKTITIDSIVDIPPMPPTTVEVESSLEAKLKAKLSISSIEAHPRLYPFGGSFFLEGMVGYSKLATDFSGEAIVNVRIKVKTPDLPDLPDLPDIPNIPGIDLPDIPKPGEDITKDTSYKVDIDTKASRDYLKYGGKLGWRVDFGKPGGFIFEHAIGWYLAKGLGKKTIVRQLADYVEKKAEDAMPDNAIMENAKAEVGKFDDAFSLLEKFIFIGGPRYTFAFGWRF